MPLIEPREARRFAEQWLEAWNRHDLDAVLSHYAEDFEFCSPLIVDFAGEPSGLLRGKAAVREYWNQGLARIPDLRFELIDVFTGIDRIVVYYRGHRGMVAESFEFGVDGRVIRAAACYA